MLNWTSPVTASQETGALKSLENQLPALVKVRTSHLETLKPWAIIHRGYCLLYSDLRQEASKLVDQVRQESIYFIPSESRIQREHND